MARNSSSSTLQNPWTTHPHLQLQSPTPLGQGSFAKVWKANDITITPSPNQNTYYAVKQIDIGKAIVRSGAIQSMDQLSSLQYSRIVNRLFTEVTHLNKFKSENVVQYYDHWFEGPDVDSLLDLSPTILQRDDSSTSPEVNFLFIQMEFCHGTLKQWLDLHPTLDKRENQLKNILIQLATGLSEIHLHGITHRDLKPDNIFYQNILNDCNNPSLIWKIGDFGFSRKVQKSEVSHHTENSEGIDTNSLSYVGCFHYRSPEMHNKDLYDKKSDVFSLGLVFYEVLHQFENDSERKTQFMELGTRKLVLIARGQFSQTSKRYPNEFRTVEEMLQPDPEIRLDSQEVVQMLRAGPDCAKVLLKARMSTNSPTTTSSLESDKITEITDENEQQYQSSPPPSIKQNERPIAFDFGEALDVNLCIYREKELLMLKECLRLNKFTVGITGISGSGKTELVNQFAKIFYSDKGNCLRFDGRSRHSFRTSLFRLATIFSVKILQDSGNLKGVDQICIEIRRQMYPGPLLIVIDDVDVDTLAVEESSKETSDILTLLNNLNEFPKEQRPLVVLCLEKQVPFETLFVDLYILDLHQIHPIDAQLFVFNILGLGEPIEEVIKLCSVLKNYPLVLRQAVLFINYRRQSVHGLFSIPQYLDEFGKQMFKINNIIQTFAISGDNNNTYFKLCLASWMVTEEMLGYGESESGRNVVILLKILSLFGPTGLEEKLLFTILSLVNNKPLTSCSGSDDINSTDSESLVRVSASGGWFKHALSLIKELSLCQFQKRVNTSKRKLDDIIVLHPMLQTAIRFKMLDLDKEDYLPLLEGIFLRLEDLSNLSWPSDLLDFFEYLTTTTTTKAQGWNIGNLGNELILKHKATVLKFCKQMYLRNLVPLQFYHHLQAIFGPNDEASVILEFYLVEAAVKDGGGDGDKSPILDIFRRYLQLHKRFESLPEPSQEQNHFYENMALCIIKNCDLTNLEDFGVEGDFPNFSVDSAITLFYRSKGQQYYFEDDEFVELQLTIRLLDLEDNDKKFGNVATDKKKDNLVLCSELLQALALNKYLQEKGEFGKAVGLLKKVFKVYGNFPNPVPKFVLGQIAKCSKP